MSALTRRLREPRDEGTGEGTLVAPVISVDFARQARTELEAGGATVEAHESPTAHQIDPRVIPDAQRWLKSTTTAGAPTA